MVRIFEVAMFDLCLFTVYNTEYAFTTVQRFCSVFFQLQIPLADNRACYILLSRVKGNRRWEDEDYMPTNSRNIKKKTSPFYPLYGTVSRRSNNHEDEADVSVPPADNCQLRLDVHSRGQCGP